MRELEVILEMGELGEAFLTNLTAVGLFSGVHESVSLDLGGCREPFAADGALVSLDRLGLRRLGSGPHPDSSQGRNGERPPCKVNP